MSGEDPKDIAQAELATSPGPQPGQTWRHYHGGRYVIVARSIMEDTLEPLVTYFSLDRGTTWTRTLANFLETVSLPIEGEAGSIELPRFRRLEEDGP